MTNKEICRLFDNNINMTLKELSRISGNSIRQLKEILLTQYKQASKFDSKWKKHPNTRLCDVNEVLADYYEDLEDKSWTL